jgi:cell division protein FtsB
MTGMRKWMDLFNKYKRKVNKYHITIVVFLVVTFFIGDNTLLDGIRYDMKIKSLQTDIESLRKENNDKLRQLNALQGDRESLEKFAREQFLMTKSGEDLFLIVE